MRNVKQQKTSYLELLAITGNIINIIKMSNISFKNYISDIEASLVRRSNELKHSYVKHGTSLGTEREDIAKSFFQNHLPGKYSVSTGFCFSSKSGKLSKESDLLIVDSLNNFPLHKDKGKQLWPTEAVFANIEIKTNLSKKDIVDSVNKCERFKNLNRDFAYPGHVNTLLKESMFIIFSFDEKTAIDTIITNVRAAIKGKGAHQVPDFIIVPNKVLMCSGDYTLIQRFGMDGSENREKINDCEVRNFKKNPDYSITKKYVLQIFFLSLQSWLRFAGGRTGDFIDFYSNTQNGNDN